ncbi:MAG: methylmalonyl-CoA epimerase [Dethiobacteria bacterium]|nr:methylmalonyl-CoA epimerase [Bacillota bacterium]MDW7730557.1 methylmalonyl-CoA epimerase [Bacillota bacterium]
MILFEKIDHIGIAVSDLEKAVQFYRDQIGIELKGTEVVDEQKVKVAFFPVGESKIELLESTEPDGPVGRFIEKKGEGVHHISFRVSNIEEKIKQLKEQGVALIDEKPRYGAGGARIAFLHPKSTGGVLVELCERDS